MRLYVNVHDLSDDEWAQLSGVTDVDNHGYFQCKTLETDDIQIRFFSPGTKKGRYPDARNYSSDRGPIGGYGWVQAHKLLGVNR